MKKLKPIVLLIGLIMCICIAFSACSVTPDSLSGGNSGAQQSQDDTEISEAMRMYQEACAAGYTGSYLEFLDEYLKPSTPPAESNTNIVVTEDGSNPGADLAALSTVKIESTYAFANSGDPLGTPRFATEYGAGVIYSLDRQNWDAYILTNYHVIYEFSSMGRETIPHVSDDINVWLFGGETESGKLSATFLGGAIDYDVAVLFINGDQTVHESGGGTHTNASVLQNSAARAITVGDSDDMTVGDTVFAIGNPVGMGISVTQGIVSVDAQYITTLALNSVIRTVTFLEMRIDAAVNHGNSGGGLFNSRGEYVGTVNAREETDGIRDFGYAIPSNLTIAIARNVIDSSTHVVRRATLSITAEIKSSHSVYDESTGRARTVQSIAVADVDSAGAVAGILHTGDVLLSATYGEVKKEITREYQLTFLIFNLRAGDTLAFEVLRNGEIVTVEINLDYTDFETIY